MKAWLGLVAGLLLLCAARADSDVGPENYDCPASCNSSPKCYCATTKPPGGLAPTDVPQFIVLTNDDSVSGQTYPVIRGITDQHKNPNGCVMPATWFVQTQYTEANLIRELYLDNHEIATHTMTHPALPSEAEIVGARKWLNETANVPLEKIVGFRAPFLQHNPEQRDILQRNGFLYSSSMTEQFGQGQASPSGSQKIWPFTMDYGVPIDCTVGTGSCSVNERHPGVWEFPLWNVQDSDGSVIASMDPQGDNLEQYKREFERNYNGNRAPLGIYLHAGLLMAFSEHQPQINQFLEWAQTHKDVWFVTIAEVLRWMKNPVPASQYKFDCTTPTDMKIGGSGKICFQPGAGCGQGEWKDDQCACACQGQTDPKSNGFCPDASGSCTVSKTYNDATRTFTCPGDSSGGSTWSPSPEPSSPGVANSTAVTVAFYVRGAKVAEVQTSKASDICEAVSRVALESATNCYVSNVTEVTPSGQTETRVWVEVTISSIKPDATRMALQSAASYGALGASLKAADVTFDGLDPAYLPASSPAPVPAPSPAPQEGSTTDESGEGGSSNVGAIVGGVVGGVAGLALAAVTAYFVVKHRQQKKRAAGSGAAAHAPSSKVDEAGGPISVVASFREAHTTSYNGSPRSSVTPRHASGTQRGSMDQHGAV